MGQLVFGSFKLVLNMEVFCIVSLSMEAPLREVPPVLCLCVKLKSLNCVCKEPII